MLVELAIENLGIIESSRLTFDSGFTAFTGETGAGKTMLVEAIGLVVGQRADVSVIRDGAEEARVEARFVTSGPDGDVETILCRVLHREGRSRAYINDRMATVATLAEVGQSLVDIHGQHAHQRLMSASVQRDSLDAFGKVDTSALREAREAVTQIDANLAALGGDEKSRVREIDLLSFQCEEIENAGLSRPDEDQALSREEDELGDVVRHQEALLKVSALLSEDGNTVDLLGQVSRALSPITSMSEIRERVENLLAELNDISHTVRGAAENSEENPERLEEIRLRRQALRDLVRKYGDTITDVMAFGAEARTRLNELLSYSERVQELESSRANALKVLHNRQLEVGRQRRKTAPGLAAAVEKRLRLLALPHATIQVAVGDEGSDPSGEAVSFMLAANPGSAPMPITKVASGGELARVMLALRLVLTTDPATMVFDEVDAGIGGAAAVAVAQALRELGTDHQVFAVTHLAQVAASAHSHIVVSKSVKSGKTYGRATKVLQEDRVGEIARMLSGGIADESALTHAQEILNTLGAPVSRGKKPR
ncbi:MAG: DNA repair protein RecN [Actinobacteria bacterium]|nr:DNA repair protein RecN [Actinomycetota bacterium]